MTKKPTQRSLRLTLAALAAILFAAARLSADVIETKSGSHLVGKVTKISDGAVTISTDYSADIVIKQKEITALVVDQPIAVRLSTGTRLQGTMAVNPNGGGEQIVGRDATASATLDQIAAAWPAGEDDPELVALRRHWTYEASADITGTSGNKDSLGTEAGFKAKMATPEDTLLYYGAYNRQVVSGEKSADQFKAGIDYSAQFAPRESWYVRDEAGFDRVMGISFSDVAAAGVGYDFIKSLREILTGRAGLSYRYEGYVDNTPALSSAGLDFEINHEYRFVDALLENKLAYVPAFKNFRNYTIKHESSYTIPLHEPNWKLQMGLANDYNSMPPRGIKRLDTTYFTRLLLDWGH